AELLGFLPASVQCGRPCQPVLAGSSSHEPQLDASGDELRPARRECCNRDRHASRAHGMTTVAVAPRPRASTTTPTRRTPDLAERLILEVATAQDVRAGIRRLITLLRRSGIERGEWWAPSEAGQAL